jgi:hypothetical protein
LGEKERRRRGIWGRVGEVVSGSGRKGGRRWGRLLCREGRRFSEVGEEYDGWGPPIRKKRKIRKGKRRKKGGAAGLPAGLLSRAGPVGLLPLFFFVLILFYFLSFAFFGVCKQNLFGFGQNKFCKTIE